MLEEHLEKLSKDVLGSLSKEKKKNIFTFSFLENILHFEKIENGFYINSTISQIPEEKLEEFFIYVMKANFLGIGTGGNIIGLNKDEKYLTLSYNFFYEINYKEFKEFVEDFINYLVYWRKEIKAFEKSA